MKLTAYSPMIAGALTLAALVLAGAGCGSAPTTRDLMVEEAHANPADRPVAMKGEGSFAAGKLEVLATVSRGFDRGGKGGHGGRPGDDRGGRRGRRDADAFTEVYSFGFGDSEEEQKEAVEEYLRQAKARRAAGSPMPPVTLRVAIENRGTEPMEVEVTDVNSDLGNFAVRPPKLTIEPGGKGLLDPMVSQLGVMNDEIPVTIAIRTGGKKETQVITVKNVLAPSLRK